eukprot:gene8945-biopygen5380
MSLRNIAGVFLGAFLLAGCNYQPVPDPKLAPSDVKLLAEAATAPVELQFERYYVDDTSGEAPGTVIIDSREHFLYFILPEKKAIRYGVATGNDAAGWTGTATIGRMAEWPHWMPPADMLERWPHLKPTAAAGGLPGGPDNPLGARGLYLYQNGRDSMYRIHGTNEPEEIGRSVSSGCIRMRNIDVIDLYKRVKIGTKVIVK